MKKIFKNPIFTFILGVILCCVTIVVADTINSNEVMYDNSNSSSSATDVQDALDDVYNTLDKVGSGYSLIAHAPAGLSTELIGGLYRYQGIQDANHNVNNYICFGTTSKSDCISNTDAYMYRIIGINENGQMKLIKKEALNTAYNWHSTRGVDWPNTTLFAGLNGSYYLTNTDYIPNSAWSNRIITFDWHYSTVISNVSTIIEQELSGEIIQTKIGLMYLHDYAYSQVTPSYSSDTWLKITKSDSNPPSSLEWTMSRANNSTGVTNGIYYIAGGNEGVWYPETASFSVRPVFFLRSSETIASGSGTLTDPYILS